MKNTASLTIAASALAAIALSSCGTSDPDYKEWKKKKAEETASSDNPYGAPAAGDNPYGTPQSDGDPSVTRAAEGAAPYQPLPGIPEPPAGSSTYPEAAGVPGAATTVGGVSHTVVSGDSLWALARKHGTTIEAIQAANGLTDTNIRTGQTLTIPGR